MDTVERKLERIEAAMSVISKRYQRMVDDLEKLICECEHEESVLLGNLATALQKGNYETKLRQAKTLISWCRTDISELEKV